MIGKTTGVLVMSYGTPESLDQVEAYYTHIRRGHPPTPEQLKELMDRYETIVGGFFPLRKNTDEQVRALQATLDREHPGVGYRCYQGLKHAGPFIEDGVKKMAEDGIRQAVGVVLAPHYSVMSVGGYIKRAQDAAEPLGIAMSFVKSYHLHPKLIEALRLRVAAALDAFEAEGAAKDEVRVIFTAHSLPEKIVEMRDPYVEQLTETARAVAERAGLTNWQIGWQSAGRTATPWLGPDILKTLRSLREEEGVKYALVCPAGFVSDHLEVLYDLDIEARRLAADIGLSFKRTASLNTDALYMETLSDVIAAQLEGKG